MFCQSLQSRNSRRGDRAESSGGQRFSHAVIQTGRTFSQVSVDATQIQPTASPSRSASSSVYEPGPASGAPSRCTTATGARTPGSARRSRRRRIRPHGAAGRPSPCHHRSCKRQEGVKASLTSDPVLGDPPPKLLQFRVFQQQPGRYHVASVKSWPSREAREPGKQVNDAPRDGTTRRSLKTYPHKSLTERSEPAEPVDRGLQGRGLSSTASFGPALNATLRAMYFVVLWTPGVNGPTVPQQGPPQWDGDALVVEGTQYVEAEWRTITVISESVAQEPKA